MASEDIKMAVPVADIEMAVPVVEEVKEEPRASLEVEQAPLKKESVRKHLCRRYACCFTCLGLTLILAAVLLPILWFRMPTSVQGEPEGITLSLNPPGMSMNMNVTIDNKNFYPLVFSDMNLRVVDMDGSYIGTVTKTERVVIPPRKSHTMIVHIDASPSLKEVMAVAGKCIKNNNMITVKAMGSVKAHVGPKKFMAEVGPLKQEAKCLTAQDLIPELQGTGIGDGQVISNIANGNTDAAVDQIQNSVEQATGWRPGQIIEGIIGRPLNGKGAAKKGGEEGSKPAAGAPATGTKPPRRRPQPKEENQEAGADGKADQKKNDPLFGIGQQIDQIFGGRTKAKKDKQSAAEQPAKMEEMGVPMVVAP